jgi:hypothetical protein
LNGLDVALRPDKPVKHERDEVPSPQSAVRRFTHGVWLVVLCFAVLALSSPRIPQPVPSGSPAISSSPADLAAITRAAALYDLSRSQSAIHAWRSEKQKYRPFQHADGTVPAAIADEIVGQRSRPESRRLPAIAAAPQFRPFDAQAPPSIC